MDTPQDDKSRAIPTLPRELAGESDSPALEPNPDIATNAQNVDEQATNSKEASTPNDLKATWDEKENLRPALQGPVDPLIGEAVLRYAKDKRSRTLDDLDNESE